MTEKNEILALWKERILQAVSSEEHPLDFFIDDLQWADLASQSLFQVMMADRQNRYFLFIGAYRDNEVSGSHPLMMIIEGVQQQGNAFFTFQFLENLYDEELLCFDFKQSAWKWDITEIEKQNISDNVVDLLVRKIKTLPPGVQDVLKLAACIGNNFDLHTLSVISAKETPGVQSKEEYREILEIALRDHPVFPSGHEEYKFVHDRIHQAAYTLVPGEDKKPLHLKIGRLLLKNFQATKTSNVSKEEEHHIFEIVNHLKPGLHLIENEKELVQLAWLNLKAGQNAKISAAYKTGAEYVHTAIRLLPADLWQQQYDLTLALYNEAIQTSYLCDNFEEMDGFVQSVLTYAREVSDKTAAYEYNIMSLTAQNKPHLAVQALINTCNVLGLNFPAQPDPTETNQILLNVHKIFEEKGIEAIKDLPQMTDPKKILIIRLLYIGITPIMFSAPQLVPYVAGLISIILENGLAPEAYYITALYAVLRILQGDIALPYQLGEFIMESLDKEANLEGFKARVCLGVPCHLASKGANFGNLRWRTRLLFLVITF